MRKRDWIIFFAALLTAAGVGLSVFRSQAAQTAGWGLCFRQQGEAPMGNENADILAEYNGFYLGNTEEKVIYLTFDAGYENGYTGQILDVLKKHNAPAAFFLVGNYLSKEPDLVRRMAREGHLVGNHTMHHPDMTAVTDLSKELTQLEDLYREITGKELAKFYRPPQGVYTLDQLEQAEKLGYTTVFWSLAYADWDNQNQPTREQALEKLLTRTHSGAIVLLHATSQTNAEILDELLTRWEEMGYRFGSLEELSAR